MVKKRYSPRTKGEYLKGSLLCNFQPRADKAEREEEKPHHSRLKIVHSSGHTCTRVCIALFSVLQYSDVGERYEERLKDNSTLSLK